MIGHRSSLLEPGESGQEFNAEGLRDNLSSATLWKVFPSPSQYHETSISLAFGE